MSKVEMIKKEWPLEQFIYMNSRAQKMMTPTQIPGLMTPHTIPSVILKGNYHLPSLFEHRLKLGK